MGQSIEIARSFTQGGHFLIDHIGGRYRPSRLRWVHRGFDAFYYLMPFGQAWLHEEFHRAVLSQHGIDSRNEVYDLDLLSRVIKVSHVTDNDLARLKQEHSADFVRLSSAGMEGEYAYLLALQKSRFFSGRNTYGRFGNFVGMANSVLYLGLSTTQYAHRITSELEEGEDSEIKNRDFTGWDFTAWVYDLHRPVEHYTNRGTHRSGVGVDRYILPGELSESEKGYLKVQAVLAFLNFADMNLLGLKPFFLQNVFGGNSGDLAVGLGHVLAPFGFSVSCHSFWRLNCGNAFLAVHHYVNRSGYFPGIEIEIIDVPVHLGAIEHVWMIPRVMAWFQPEAQSFYASKAEIGFLGSVKLAIPLKRTLIAHSVVGGKTKGWVSGIPSLSKGFWIRFGVTKVLGGR